MANENLDVHVVLDVLTPASPVNLGNFAVYVVGATPITDIKLTAFADVEANSIVLDANAEAVVRAFFAQPNHAKYLYLYGVTTSVDQSAMTAKVNETITDDWEFATVVSSSANDTVVLANAVEQYGRKFAVTGADLALDTAKVSDLATIEELPFLGNERTILFLANSTAGVTEKYNAVGALVGALGNSVPGAITWKFKSLVGVKASDVSGSVLAKLNEIGVITYVIKSGTAQTSEGLTTGLEFIDNLHGDDWVRASIETSIQALLQSTDKLAYGAAGIAQLEAAVTTVLRNATDNGIILVDTETGAGTFTVDAGTRAEQSASDIANRIYNGLSFTYKRAGAIHDVTVHGTISNI